MSTRSGTAYTTDDSPLDEKGKGGDPPDSRQPGKAPKDKNDASKDEDDVQVVGQGPPPSSEQLYASFKTPLKLWTGFIACDITDINTAKVLS